MKKKVLFLDTVHPNLEERLIEAGWECDHDYSSDYSAIHEKIDPYHGLVIRSRIPVDRKLFEAAKSLEFVARSGSGLENIDLKAAKDHKVQVYSSPEGNRQAVAEHALGMLLSLFNKLNRADSEVRKGIWLREENRGLELSGKTVGIIGFGNTGSAFAKVLSGFGCTILAYDKYKEGYAPDYVRETSLDELKTKADIISIHLPLSEETMHYADVDFISSVANDFYLINTARGKHVDTEALVSALKSGKIKGACLDVLEYEKRSLTGLEQDQLPAAYQELLGFDNVILTPHVAGWTTESYIKLSSVLADKILADSKP